ncbi:MAG TPA: chemotaxis protein CheW [Gemmatimonadaceae bacterium]|nr:chemotaxis protein CheW [Gemmatimonadaceae bacterium]
MTVNGAPETGTEMLLFRQGGELFALALDAALEVVEMPRLESVPDMSAGMLGVFPVRGAYVPVYAPESALGVQGGAPHAAVLILRRGDRPIGIALEDVEDVIMVNQSLLHQPLGATGAGVVLGVERRGGDLVGIVDAQALVEACATPRTGESE